MKNTLISQRKTQYPQRFHDLIAELDQLIDQQLRKSPIADWYLLRLRSAVAGFQSEAV